MYYIYILQQNIRKTTIKSPKLAMAQLRYLEIGIKPLIPVAVLDCWEVTALSSVHVTKLQSPQRRCRDSLLWRAVTRTLIGKN